MRTRSLLLAAVLILTTAIAASATPDNLVIILDASNSMNKLLAVKTRIDAGKDALTELLGGMPAGQEIGLMVFGHRVDKDDEVRSCQDIEMLFPIAPLDDVVRGRMVSAIEQVTPQGKTPLADSLTVAANAISERGEGGVIVLLSDGEGNCGGAQDIVAAMIATLNPPVRIHVLGLDVEAEASDVLRGIASATGGSYWSIQEAGELLEALYAAVASDDAIVTDGSSGMIPSQFACLGVTNVIYGTEGDDVIYGTEAGDLILGLGGDDFLIGLDGNDVLCGGPGDDILEGCNGDDLLDGGDGDDLIFGGDGNDQICGGFGNDSLEGDLGDDVIDGGVGKDILLGGRGCNVLYAADGIDTLLEGTIMPGSYNRCPMCEPTCPPAIVCPPFPAAPLCPVPATCPPPVAVQPVCPAPSAMKTLNEGESIQLHGTVSDADCNVVTSAWQASAGVFDDPCSLHPVYTAPMLTGCEDLDVEVILTAVDSCGESASDSFFLHICNVNHMPIVDAGEPICINEGESVVLPAVASDIDCEGLMYQWSVNGNLGSFQDPYVLRGVFVAPQINACDGVDIIATLAVTDPCGATVCDTVLIHVQNVNTAPAVELGSDFAVDEGMIIQMTPAVSDAEGDALRYCWTTTAGAFDDPYAACPTLCIPMTAQCAGESLIVTLTVTDPCGLSASDSVGIHVNNVNAAPTVDLGSDLCLLECDSVLLCPIVRDPNGDPLVFSWSASAGAFADLGASSTLYTAPATDNCDGTYTTITLTVTDPCGLSATDSIQVRVENINRPPTVHADP